MEVYYCARHKQVYYMYIHIVEIIPKRESTHENVQSCPSNKNIQLIHTSLFHTV